jgi:hypothetical protein
MLVTSFQTQPVWHITALARTATWGFLFLGVERGLAWQWWFPLAGCFTVLLLLFEIILKGRTHLAAFGALWFCSSAYVVAWSNWPAQIVMWGALICLSAYWLAATLNWRIQLLNALLLGIGVMGYAMMLYPPWQIPLFYLFAFLFLGLLLRDKLYRRWRKGWLVRLACCGVAFAVAGGLAIAWFLASWDAMQLVSNTEYPGKRVSAGGDYPFAYFFKGNFNLLSLYNPPYNPDNQSESASFYMLYPAVFGALALSGRLRRAWGWVGWTLIIYILFMLEYMIIGLPDFLAKLTLMSYVTPVRVDIGLGLASIIVCIYLQAHVKELDLARSKTGSSFVVWAVMIGTGLLFLWNGLAARTFYDSWPAFQAIVLVAGFAVVIVYIMLRGNSRAFYGLLGLIVGVTSLFFNPLSTGLNYICICQAK